MCDKLQTPALIAERREIQRLYAEACRLNRGSSLNPASVRAMGERARIAANAYQAAFDHYNNVSRPAAINA